MIANAPNPKKASRVSRRRSEHDLSTYSGLLAARLRSLRDDKGWSMQDLHDRLSERGHEIPMSTLFAYERGKHANGADLPWDLVPVFAQVYGFRSPRGLLDQRFPEG